MITKNNSGFTLIELVIVVAIIGILATAVLSGTDFLDQRNQAADIGNYNVARNLQAAYEQGQIQASITPANNSFADLTGLKQNNIVKQSFTIPSNTFTIFVDSNSSVSVQFSLASKKFKNVTCDAAGTGFWRVPDCGQLK